MADEYAVYDAYCKQNRIVAADHQRALELVALTQSNPAEAIKQLEAIANGLKLQAGQILPVDLQKQVDEGEMTEKVAKDIAKLRLEKGKLELGQKAQAESHVQQQQQQLNQSLNSWTQSKMKTDLDFHPKSDANAPDGRYELVLTKFRELWQTTPVYSIDEAVGLAERAYKSVMEYHSQYVRKPAATRKPLTSNGSSTTKAEQKIDVTKAGWGRQVARSVINGD